MESGKKNNNNNNNILFELDTNIGRYRYSRDTRPQCGERQLHGILSF